MGPLLQEVAEVAQTVEKGVLSETTEDLRGAGLSSLALVVPVPGHPGKWGQVNRKTGSCYI